MLVAATRSKEAAKAQAAITGGRCSNPCSADPKVATVQGIFMVDWAQTNKFPDAPDIRHPDFDLPWVKTNYIDGIQILKSFVVEFQWRCSANMSIVAVK